MPSQRPVKMTHSISVSVSVFVCFLRAQWSRKIFISSSTLKHLDSQVTGG